MIIYKYPLSLSGVNVIACPEGSTVLTVQIQKNNPCLWIRHLKKPYEDNTIKRKFVVVPTGETNLPYWDDKLSYVGTFQMANGAVVLHVFEIV